MPKPPKGEPIHELTHTVEGSILKIHLKIGHRKFDQQGVAQKALVLIKENLEGITTIQITSNRNGGPVWGAILLLNREWARQGIKRRFEGESILERLRSPSLNFDLVEI